MEGNKPVKKFKSGSIEGCIWENKKAINGSEVIFKTASLTRRWKKNNEDIWHSDVINIRKSDIPKLQAVLNKLHEELYLNSDEDE
ncbi:hypothetical protein J4468_04120 [Candidatus Woesearchaeota archaeon]|nr:hypothetical protein [Candidatus Woesearchaeota archaeon]